MNKFINLHVQSHYSILHAIPTIDELINTAKLYDQEAIALTDYNNMFGIPEFIKKTKNNGIKPIFGTKIDIMEHSRFSSQRKNDPIIKKYTLILLAKNYQGYQNLLKIISHGYDDGRFGRFCVDKLLLSKFSDNLIALSSDSGGEVFHYATQKNIQQLKSVTDFYQDLYGKENYFIEIQDINSPESKFLIDYSHSNDIPLIATSPIKYIHKNDKRLLDIVSCIRKKDFLLDEEISNGIHYFKSYKEIMEEFQDHQEIIANTLKVAQLCHVNFPPIEDQSPQYPIPHNQTAEEYLKQKSKEELTKRLKGKLTKHYEDRLTRELDTVCSMGFPNYFLVVGDFVQFAKKNGILVGPGRGSAAGSLISYALGITNIDPLRYDLLFERFLNPDRVSMPDIDIDFEDERRDEVKQYLRTNYGASKTADVVTFGYNKAKAVLKDVGRVLEIPLYRVNQITNKLDPNIDLGIQAQSNNDIKSILSSTNQKEIEWINYSIQLANRIRNLGTHASALIVAGKNLNKVIPLFKDRSNAIITGFEGKYLEENGLLKMDILGLSTLSIIKTCLTRIYHTHQISINLDEINLDDSKVFDTFSNGHTAGIFQFESPGMTNYIKQLKPSSIEDLIAMNALYRPGPMESIPSFINRKLGKEKSDCFHKNLEPILKTTYGIIVYQEQVMQIAQVLSGFSLGEADIIRRIMAKKKPDELEQIRPKWIKGAEEQGYEIKLAEQLFDLLIPFSNYAFNKSHAAAYSVLAYQIAWLKTHYPIEFMASLMSLTMGKQDDLVKYIKELKQLDGTLLMPNINQSYLDFQVEYSDDELLGIRYGFGAIKGLGENASLEIIRERERGGNFFSIEDFIERTVDNPEIRKASTDILLRAGAFDSLIDSNDFMHQKAIYLDPQNLNILYQKYDKKEEKKENIVMNLFSTEEIQAASHGVLLNKNINPLSFEEEFQNEIKVFGFYLTKKLFSTIEESIGYLTNYQDNQKDILPLNTIISFMGYISNIHIAKNQNKHRSWGKFTLNTEQETIDFFLFGEKLENFEINIQEGTFIYLKAKVIERKEQRTYEIDNFINLYNNNPSHGELHVFLSNTFHPHIKDFLQELQEIAYKDYRENAHHRIIFYIQNEKETTLYRAASNYRIHFPSDKIGNLLKKAPILGYWFI